MGGEAVAVARPSQTNSERTNEVEEETSADCQQISQEKKKPQSCLEETESLGTSISDQTEKSPKLCGSSIGLNNMSVKSRQSRLVVGRQCCFRRGAVAIPHTSSLHSLPLHNQDHTH